MNSSDSFLKTPRQLSSIPEQSSVAAVSSSEGGGIVWEPSPDQREQANITRFARTIAAKYTGSSEAPYLPPPPDAPFSTDPLREWGVKYPERFWEEVWSELGVIGERGKGPTLQHLPNDAPPFARWFEDSRLNFAENLLQRRDDAEAIVFLSENGLRRAVTFRELAAQSFAVARFLRECGVNKGDRVAGYLPNLPESIVAMLGATAIGALWSSTSPDFGAPAVIERLEQIAPKVLFTADGYFYNGKQISLRDKVQEIVRGVPSVERVVVIRLSGDEANPAHTPFETLLSPPAPEIPFERFPFNHPLYILYSSGTTGAPKCITHGAGGTLLQHLKELVLHTDLKRDERIFYFTTCGWMMWNWLVSSLAVGATVVVYDGSPFAPTSSRLLELVEEERVSVFGTSAKYLLALEKAAPTKIPPLTHLRAILSTGSPLPPQSFDFVYRHLKSSVQLASISGGTDIISCFVLGDPTRSVYRGEIQGAGLGMDVAIFDPEGREILGEAGELVCKAPFPSMPVCFWNDPGGARFRGSYFETFFCKSSDPESAGDSTPRPVWRHGDWAKKTERDSFVIYGRSDTVLNPGGVRIGTAEIYRAVEALEEVLESVAIGQQWESDERIVLFVRLREGVLLDDDLQARIKNVIRERNTPRHVPAVVLSVADIPKTMNGKISELAVKNVVHGQPVQNQKALLNPESLAYFANRAELR